MLTSFFFSESSRSVGCRACTCDLATDINAIRISRQARLSDADGRPIQHHMQEHALLFVKNEVQKQTEPLVGNYSCLFICFHQLMLHIEIPQKEFSIAAAMVMALPSYALDLASNAL